MHHPWLVEVLGMGRPRRMRAVDRVFWRGIGAGLSTADAAAGAGMSASAGVRAFRQAGGMSPLELSEPTTRYLSLAEREEIANWRGRVGVREIARMLGRSASTISRELTRNAPPSRPCRYRASTAQAKAEARARRPKTRKLEACPRLHAEVTARLTARCSPEQISHRLVLDFPDDEQMRVSHETIYRGIYVQGRGALRRELARALRTGRALRKPRRRVDARTERIKDMVMITDRPAEVEDRAVPGHWEGDLIIGAHSASAIGTLVERTTRFTMLLHLPVNHGAVAVADAIAEAAAALPTHLRRSLTWDQGIELAGHAALSITADLPVYFCDPASPWQRGTNENTNGLLRQYFPKGTDLSIHPAAHLDAVAAELNDRPRKTLHWSTPAEALTARLCDPEGSSGVATAP